MAYLSNDDEKSQQAQGQGQSNFDILAPASSATSGGQSGGQNQSSGGSAAASQGGASGASASQSADDAAQNYSQSLSGASPQDLSAPSSSVIKPGTSKTGLTSGTSGGGYINFQSYANANPSAASNITAGGNSLLSSEGTLANQALSVDPNSGYSTPLSSQPGSISRVSDMITNDSPDQWSKDSATLGGLMNETYTAPTVDYTPSDRWNTDAPELSQTGIIGGGTGGSAGPSVIDYLSRPDIQAGTYGLGERSLDSALISADPKAQAALSDNANRLAQFQTDTTGKLSDLNTKISDAAAYAPQVQANARGAVDTVQGQKQSVVDAINADNTKSEAQKVAEVKAYKDWINSGGAATSSFDINNKASNPGTVDLNTATSLNRIADLQGSPEPYPNFSGSAAGTKSDPGSYTWNITPQGSGVDSGMKQITQDEAAAGISQANRDDPNAPNYANFEAAVNRGEPLTSDQVDVDLAHDSVGGLRDQYNELSMEIAAANKGGNTKGAAAMTQEQKMLGDAITRRQQSTLQLAQSLGLSADDMKALGF